MSSVKIRYGAAAALLGLMLSQLGHMLAYAEHYGPRGLRVEATGIHAYFPAVLAAGAGFAGAAVLVALLLIGAGRVAAGKSLGGSVQKRQSVLALFAVAGAVQLDAYLLQEMTETLLAGGTLSWQSLLEMLQWGFLGQLPLAFLLALGLSWISSQLPAALAVLRLASGPLSVALTFRLGSQIHPQPLSIFLPIACVCGATALVKRGPPLLFDLNLS